METTLNQEVRKEIRLQKKHNEVRMSPNVVAAAKAAAKTILDQEAKPKTETVETKVTKETKKPETKPTVKKEKKVRAESMEGLALRLRKEKANEATILKAFTAAYKVKGQTDVKFIKPRIVIYLKIADKAIANAKPAK